MKRALKVFVSLRSIAIIALVVAIGFSFAACGGGDDGGGGGGGGGDGGSGTTETFTNGADFATWLAAQPDNNITGSSYTVKLNISDLGDSSSVEIRLAIFSDKKHVDIDFSGSTFTNIEDEFFYNCFGLTGITIPDSVTSIGNRAFSGCTNLSRITIPNTVTSIGNYAFQKCTHLNSITIPNSVTSIGNYAFQECTYLTSINIGTITNISFIDDLHSLTAINIDDANTEYSSIDGVVYNQDKTTLIRCPEKKRGTLTIPNTVTSIGNQAFMRCFLTSVTIGNSVTSIGDLAFSCCYDLTNITIPDSVISIGDQVFTFCSSLTSVTIGKNVTSIGVQVFTSCARLTSITIGKNVSTIGVQAFRDCTSLAGITIPDSVTSIGEEAFSGCTSLTSVTFTTGSNISNSLFKNKAFPEGSTGDGGDTLKTAYSTGKAGTYTRRVNGSTWTKTS